MGHVMCTVYFWCVRDMYYLPNILQLGRHVLATGLSAAKN